MRNTISNQYLLLDDSNSDQISEYFDINSNNNIDTYYLLSKETSQNNKINPNLDNNVSIDSLIKKINKPLIKTNKIQKIKKISKTNKISKNNDPIMFLSIRSTHSYHESSKSKVCEYIMYVLILCLMYCVFKK